MQIVIELSDETYKAIKEENGIYTMDYELCTRMTGKVVGAIQAGTILPKGHGELKESSRIKSEVFNACTDKYFMPIKSLDCDTITEIINNILTIIEADT